MVWGAPRSLVLHKQSCLLELRDRPDYFTISTITLVENREHEHPANMLSTGWCGVPGLPLHNAQLPH
jgi:hypothetical protein